MKNIQTIFGMGNAAALQVKVCMSNLRGSSYSLNASDIIVGQDNLNFWAFLLNLVEILVFQNDTTQVE